MESGEFKDSHDKVRRTNHYDEDGKLINYEIFEYGEDFSKQLAYDANGELFTFSIIRKLTDGISRTEHYYSDSLERYTDSLYDDSGKVQRENHYFADGEMSGYSIYEYNSDDNMTKKMHYHADGRSNGGMVWEYDDKGNRTKQTDYGENGEITHYWILEYDQEGNLIKTNSYDADGTFIGWSE